MTQLQAMALSIALEVPVLALLAWWWGLRTPLWRVCAVGVVATVLTHPFVWHGIPLLEPWIASWPLRAGIAEVSAAAAEALVFLALLRWPVARAAGASVVANAWSFGVGLGWFLWLQPWLATPRCPDGTTADADRASQIRALVDARVDARLCFGHVPERGVRDPQGRYRLDAETDDRLLAARVWHLMHHERPLPNNDSCLEVALRHEVQGWAAELTWRKRLGVSDPDCPVEALETSASIRDWMEHSDHYIAIRLRDSHRLWCQSRVGRR